MYNWSHIFLDFIVSSNSCDVPASFIITADVKGTVFDSSFTRWFIKSFWKHALSMSADELIIMITD